MKVADFQEQKQKKKIGRPIKEKPVERGIVVFFADHTESFRTKEIASQSLDIAPFVLTKAIRTGKQVLTAGGYITADYLY